MRKKKTFRRTKLTEDQVAIIRRELENDTASIRWLAKEFGVTHGAIMRIKRNETWRHVLAAKDDDNESRENESQD